MARSNTLPIDPPKRTQSKAEKNKPLPRSATEQMPPPKKLHLPFHHSSDSKKKDHASPPMRPNAPNRMNSVQTRYMNMLLDLDTIPRLHNILASFFTWILLAGFIIFPGTFTSLSALADDPSIQDSRTASKFLSTVKHVSLLYIASFCSGVGAIGMMWLWYRWRANFVWLLNRIFLPGCLNSFAGLISTLVQVYSQQAGAWSVTAIVTAGVTGGSMVILGLLFTLYNFWILARVKSRHHGDMRRANTGDFEGEGLVDKIERKVNEPGLEPGSVV